MINKESTMKILIICLTLYAPTLLPSHPKKRGGNNRQHHPASTTTGNHGSAALHNAPTILPPLETQQSAAPVLTLDVTPQRDPTPPLTARAHTPSRSPRVTAQQQEEFPMRDDDDDAAQDTTITLRVPSPHQNQPATFTSHSDQPPSPLGRSAQQHVHLVITTTSQRTSSPTRSNKLPTKEFQDGATQYDSDDQKNDGSSTDSSFASSASDYDLDEMQPCAATSQQSQDPLGLQTYAADAMRATGLTKFYSATPESELILTHFENIKQILEDKQTSLPEYLAGVNPQKNGEDERQLSGAVHVSIQKKHTITNTLLSEIKKHGLYGCLTQKTHRKIQRYLQAQAKFHQRAMLQTLTTYVQEANTIERLLEGMPDFTSTSAQRTVNLEHKRIKHRSAKTLAQLTDFAHQKALPASPTQKE